MTNPGARPSSLVPEQATQQPCSSNMANLHRFSVAVLLGALMAACVPTTPLPQTTAGGPPESFPERYYLRALADHRAVYAIDPASSLVVIDVRRGGPLARLGHDHVVSSHDARGYVAPDEGRADMYFELDRLVVDEPALRADAGFDSTPSEDDVAGTRRNMLARVLDAKSHPFALVSVTDAQDRSDPAMRNVEITLRGATHVYRVPVDLRATPGEIAAGGRLSIRQTDFGIEPLAILNGAIQVQDELELRFAIVARLARN
ncbi:MAG TPA: YceI family protein [Casimicrobiaceae bacterium]|nr:YceI family protein [Casimicrobiaceae bacterium]